MKSTAGSYSNLSSYNCRGEEDFKASSWDQKWLFSELSDGSLDKLRGATEFCVKLDVDMEVNVLDHYTTSSIQYSSFFTASKLKSISLATPGTKNYSGTFYKNYTPSSLSVDVADLSVRVQGTAKITCDYTVGSVLRVGGTTSGKAGSLGYIYIYYK